VNEANVVVTATAVEIYAWYAAMLGVQELTEAQKRAAHGMARLDPKSVKQFIEAQKVAS
jgi:hypothetical protein